MNAIYKSAIASFMVALLLTVLNTTVFQETFFQNQYKSLNTAQSMKMSESDLFKATHSLFDYLKDKQDHIDLKVRVDNRDVEMFNTREKTHMVDVKNLYQGIMTIRLFCSCYSLLIMGVYLLRRDYLNPFQSLKNIVHGIMMPLIVLAWVSLYAYLDFSSFWIHFHQLLFNNDLWLLNPATDRMIQMFPEPFFNALVMRIIIVFGTVFMAAILVATVFQKYLKKRSNV